ncbi:O-antigen ligase family protein [Pelagibacterales bacterium]|nr:O-antigen ligase family protein [Pelagibacterales bacterium]
MKIYINSISCLLVYLLPLALLTGPFLPDFFICIVGILVTFLILREKKYTYFNNNYFIIFILFCTYLIIRSFFAKSVAISLEHSLFYFRFGLFSIAVWYLIENNNRFIKNFSIFLLATFLFTLVDGYYQYFYEVNIFGFSEPGTRLSLPLNEKAILGGYLARLFPLLLAVLIYTFDIKKFHVVLILFMLILTDLLIFISGERTALGLLFLSTVFILTFLSKYKKIRFYSFLISILLMILIAALNPSIKERNIDHTINQLTANSNQSITLFSNQHQSHILGAWKMFVDNPLVGQGPKMFRILCNDVKFNPNEDTMTCSTHPHNLYVQLLAETGLLGLLFLLVLCFTIVKLILNHIVLFAKKREYLLSDFQICLIACLIMTLWPIIPSMNFFSNWMNVIFYLPVGFFLYSLNNREKN